MNLSLLPRVFAICLLGSVFALAEGIASMTTVTADNCRKLAHHELEVRLKPQRGLTGVSVFVHASKEHPPVACRVTIYRADDTLVGREAILSRFDLPVHSRPLHFDVADELVDHVEIRYHLDQDEFRSHVYTIPRGELRSVAKRG